MEYKDMVVKRVWTGKDGQENARWLKVGTLKITDEGKMFAELNHMSDDVYIFDQKPREPQPQAAEAEEEGF